LLVNQTEKIESYIEDKYQDFNIANVERPFTETRDLIIKPTHHISFDDFSNDEITDLSNKKNYKAFNKLLHIKGKFSGAAEFVGNNYVVIDSRNTLDVNKEFSISFWLRSIDGGISGPILNFVDKNDKTILNVTITHEKKSGFGAEKRSPPISGPTMLLHMMEVDVYQALIFI